MRTVFVNPSPSMSNPRRRKARKSRGRKSRKGARRSRRNAGITSFVSNPLIMSNPHRIKRRRSARNPLAGLNLNSLLGKGLTYGGGAAVAVGANTLFLNSVSNFYARNGMRFAGAVASTMFLKGELGAAAAGGMFYPMMQELAAKFLGGSVTGVSGMEADLEGLAADLEDVMDDLDESDLSDDEMYLEDDESDILS